jgi:hypothetical protein
MAREDFAKKIRLPRDAGAAVVVAVKPTFSKLWLGVLPVTAGVLLAGWVLAAKTTSISRLVAVPDAVVSVQSPEKPSALQPVAARTESSNVVASTNNQFGFYEELGGQSAHAALPQVKGAAESTKNSSIIAPGYWVQLAALPTAEAAEHVRQQWLGQQPQTHVFNGVNAKGETVFRVRSGPFSEDQAKAMVASVQAAGQDSLLLKVD